MPSVVIAAFNEANVIDVCLSALTSDPSDLDIVVVPNGCTDATAEVARSFPGVVVIELPGPGKAAALNAADAAARTFPRAYLDADMSVSGRDLERLFGALGGQVLAVAPRREVDVSGRPLPIRAYFAIHRHLPVMAGSLFGRGLVVVSEEGRQRFTAFPDLVADDLFLDGLFGPAQKLVVADVVSIVQAPRRTADLYRRLVRVRRGNAVMRVQAGTAGVRSSVAPADRTAWLRVVLLKRPWLAPAAAWYVALTLAAAMGARRDDHGTWGRDESSRQPVA